MPRTDTAAHLVILAHGSTRAAWRAPIEALRARVAEQAPGPVHLAWLEAAPPDLLAVLGDAVAAGATSVQILPLFWSSGGHVARDVPPLLAEARARWPGLAVAVLPTVGEHPRVIAALASIALEVSGGPGASPATPPDPSGTSSPAGPGPGETSP